jgi:hypothetical protein
MSNLADHCWPLRGWWTGDLIGFHTKRLILGGTEGANNDAGLAVRSPELWDHTTGLITLLAEKPKTPQLYHSSGVLLPDGRVLTGGGGEPPFSGKGRITEFWIYKPPYLHQDGSRPTIKSVSDTSLVFGQNFSIGTSNPSEIARVTLLHLPSQTHGYNFGQGATELTIKSRTTSSLNLVAPKTDIPPGRYYLFILDSRGVPSVAKIVQIG